MTEEQIKARIAELEQYRTNLIHEGNLEIARVTGGILELTLLLERLQTTTADKGDATQ